MASTWCAEMTLEQVDAAKMVKGLLLNPFFTFQDCLHRRFEIVVADTLGHAAEEFKGFDMTQPEGFLFLTGKGHDEGASGEGQFHQEQLHCNLVAIHDDGTFTPIYLRICAWVELQW